MATADLKADLKDNLEQLVALASSPEAELKTPDAILAHLKDTLWPFLEGLVDQVGELEEECAATAEEIEEIGEAVDELTEQRGSVLMPNEAGVFALLVQLSRALADKLEKGTQVTRDEIAGLRIACDAAEKTLHETTINIDLDDADPTTDDDEEDEDDNDD